MIAKSFQNFQVINNLPDSVKTFKTGKKGFLNSSKGIPNDFNSVLETIMGKGKRTASAATFKRNTVDSQNPVNGKKENALMDALLGNFKADDLTPQAFMVDAKGIKILEQLMGSLGFAKDDISSLISDLTDGGTQKKFSFSTLLAKTKTFLESGSSHDELAMSALPFIESLLAGMGVETKEIETLLSNAGKDSGGLDLQDLIAGLKVIADSDDMTKTAGGVEMNTASRQLLAGLGLKDNGKGMLSLDEFISKLETMADMQTGKRISAGRVAEIGKSFGESLHKADADKIKNTGKPFLNNHSFQKQQQMAEEAFNTEGLKEKLPVHGKSPESPLIMKEGGTFSDKKSLPTAFVRPREEVNGQSVRMGLSTETMAGKTETPVFKSLSEKPLPSYVTNQVGRQIANAVKNGESTIKFQIKPPEMGRVQISMEFTKNGLKVGILAEHSATRDMLLSNSGDLKSILGDQGIRLDKVDVDVSGDFDQSMADARRDSNNTGGRQNGENDTENSYDQVAGGETISLPDKFVKGTEDGRLDLVV